MDSSLQPALETFVDGKIRLADEESEATFSFRKQISESIALMEGDIVGLRREALRKAYELRPISMEDTHGGVLGRQEGTFSDASDAKYLTLSDSAEDELESEEEEDLEEAAAAYEWESYCFSTMDAAMLSAMMTINLALK
ncbi:hypothetical protein STEG23_008430, partial [Scotinomys teguina]